MRQHFVLADQGSGCDLRHHESGIQSCARSEKRRQAFIQCWIHQPLQAPLRDSGQSAKRDAKKIQRKRHRFTVKVSTGEDVAFVFNEISICEASLRWTAEGGSPHKVLAKKNQRI